MTDIRHSQSPSPTPSPERAALIVVDLQPDFMPGGALPIADADVIVPGVRELMIGANFGTVVATQDWHPDNHMSFASQHADADPFDLIDWYGHTHTLWPDHCVQDTPGAALAEGLPWSRAHAIIRKGTDRQSDSYSAFRNNHTPAGERPTTGLAGFLRERGITDVFVCGLARDVCARWTAEDAAAAGFTTFFVWDLTRPVDPRTDARVRDDLENAGVRIVGLNGQRAVA